MCICRRNLASGCAAVALALAAPPPVAAADLAARTLLLDGATVGASVIAVGERGTILRSTDNARTWTPEKSPTLATLTGVSFANAQRGWAVGHDALILATRDGGVSWTKQWQGENLSDSFLDVAALDSTHVIAIGAYGLCLTTADGGKSWVRQHVQADDYHLNAIARGPSGELYIAGEHGTLLHSTDGGATWRPIPAPYEGSFYGVLPIDAQTLLAFGLRGRVFRSSDDGSSWVPIDVGRSELIAAGVQLRNGALALAGQTRVLLLSRDNGITFVARDVRIPTGIAQLVQLTDGCLLALGETGARRIEVQLLAFDRDSRRPVTIQPGYARVFP